MISLLPDELWTKVLTMGVEAGSVDYRDLCLLAFVSRRLKQLSTLDCVWRPVWERDFVAPEAKKTTTTSSASLILAGRPVKRNGKERVTRCYKDEYKIRFEKVKAARMLAHRRRVLRVESQVAVLLNEAQQCLFHIQVERDKLSSVLVELKNLELARQSAVAVQVWQPHAVRAQQQEVMEQQPVNVGSRQRSLEMEVILCRKQIQQFEKSLDVKKRAIAKTSQELESLKFNPSHDFHDSELEPSDFERAARKAVVKRKHATSASSSQTSQPV